jgi:hypothetical protein
VVKTAAPEWFWRAEVTRPFEFVSDAFDVGCLQPNSVDVDAPGTLAAYDEIAARNAYRADAELDDLRRRGARMVVSDVPPFPLTLAARLNIPGLLVANFTWADIYADLAGDEPGLGPLARELEGEYAQATLLLDADLALPMTYLERRERIGLVARPHRDRRDDLLRLLPPQAASKRIALLYLGNWGLPLPWERLEAFAGEWHFVSLGAPPVPIANLTTLAQNALPHADLVASCDLVVSKPGYGLVGECLSAGTPFLYCPRPQFAEYRAMEAALSAWPGGLRLSNDDFLEVRWETALARVPVRGALPQTRTDGGQRAASTITDYYRHGAHT